MAIEFNDSFPLRSGRVHEALGPGAASFAAICAAQQSGPLFWVRESWQGDQINPIGLLPFIDPSRLLIAQAGDALEALAVTEEALRDGIAPLVITEISRPMSLKAGRRLQLAATDGKSTGLCLIPEGEGFGSNAAETRWNIRPVLDSDDKSHGRDSTLMRWEIIKNKSGTLRSWDVRWDHTSRRVFVVPPVAQRPGS